MNQENITGLGNINVDINEYTSTSMLTAYTNAVSDIQSTFNKTTGLSAADYDDLIKQIQILKNLGVNGVQNTVPATNSGVSSYTTYFNTQMVNPLQGIMNSLAVVNIPPSATTPPLTDAEKVQSLQSWQTLPQYGVNITDYFNQVSALTSYTVTTTNSSGLPTNLVVQAFPTRSIQSALELDYINFSNQLISSKLTDLESSLTLSQQILNTLTNAQTAINQITVSPTQPAFQFPPSAASFDPAVGTDAYTTLLNDVASNTDNVAVNLANGIKSNDSNTFAIEINRIWNSTDPNDAQAKGVLNTLVNLFNINSTVVTLPLNPPVDSSFPTTAFISVGLITINNPLAYLLQRTTLPTLTAAAIVDYHANTTNAPLTPSTIYSDPEAFKQAYETAASAYFAQIIPSAVIPNVTAAATNLTSIYNLLQSQIQAVVTQNSSPSAAANVPGSFANTLFVLAAQLSAFKGGMGGLSAVKAFILDGQQAAESTLSTNTATQPTQNAITNAISATESLQGTQRESVKRYLFIFQQFYQTSAAMLTAIATLFQKITRNIGQ